MKDSTPLPIEFHRSWDNNFSFITAIRESAAKIYLKSQEKSIEEKMFGKMSDTLLNYCIKHFNSIPFFGQDADIY